jgi:hypothetical protein
MEACSLAMAMLDSTTSMPVTCAPSLASGCYIYMVCVWGGGYFVNYMIVHGEVQCRTDLAACYHVHM